MLLVHKLYIKEFLRVLGVLVIGLSLVFSIISLIDKVDDLLPFDPSVAQLLEYAVLQVPRLIHYLLPMAILLGSLFVFAQAIKRREIVAIKAAGGRMKRVLVPFIVLGVVLTLFGFALSELLIPPSVKRLAAVIEEITMKKREVSFKGGTLYMRSRDGSVVRVSLYLPDQRLAQGVTIFTVEGGGLKQRIDAERATWAGDRWRLMKVKVLNLAEGKTEEFPEMDYKGIESEEVFREEMWKTVSMSLSDLFRYQERLAEAGFKNEKIDVDIGSRLSYPLINFFMLLLGIALSLGDAPQRLLHRAGVAESRTHGTLVTAGFGLVISLAYWFGYSFFLSLGYAGILPPRAAPWVMPAVFSVLSFWLYRLIPE
ncbi:MAG: LptF/LptG family permease [Chloroflexota bacterium]